MKRVNNMPPEECFTRTLFGGIMVLAVFVSWGKWVTLTLGVLFLISAFQGFCVTCVLYPPSPEDSGYAWGNAKVM